MKKKIIALASSLVMACCIPLVGCGEPQAKTEQEKLYDSYVVYAQESGDQVLSYEQWLASIKGETGPAGAQGATGAPGQDGADGLTPFIGENGNWWIGETDTGVKAEGTDGQDGVDGEDGKDGVDGENGKDGAQGAPGKDGVDGEDGKNGVDGKTPFIGENGNWWIGETDTGIKAEGKDGVDGEDGVDGAPGKDGVDGEDGKDGAQGAPGKDGVDGEDGKDGVDGKTPFIGENGNWWIGETDTGIKAEGKDGVDGEDGKDGVDGAQGEQGEVGRTGVVVTSWNQLVAATQIPNSYVILGCDITGATSSDTDLRINAKRDLDFILDLNGFNLNGELDIVSEEGYNVNAKVINGSIGSQNIHADAEAEDFMGVFDNAAGGRIYYGILIKGENINLQLENIVAIGYYGGIYDNGSSDVGSLDAKNCYFVSKATTYGAYLASGFTTTFEECYFVGGAGAYIKGGNVTFNNCYLEGLYDINDTYVAPSYNGNGATGGFGNGIIVDRCNGYNDVNVVVNGGGIGSTTARGVVVVSTKAPEVEEEVLANVSLNGVQIFAALEGVEVEGAHEVVLENVVIEATGSNGVVWAKDGAKVVISGENTAINAIEAKDPYAMAVWANTNSVVDIYAGSFSQTIYGSDSGYDLIYAKSEAVVNIYGGIFKGETPNWTLNQHDTTNAQINVFGGSFYGYNPEASITENPIANFVEEGFEAVEGEDGFWNVVEIVE